MKKIAVLTLAALVATSLIAAGSAQAQTADVPDPGHPRVNEVDQRLENQQNRINNGVNSGQLTPKETARLQKRDTGIANRASKDEAKNGGHLTKGEQRRLNRRLNHTSRAVHRKKHNGQTTTPAAAQ